MEHSHDNTPPQALPGLWREAGGLASLVRQDVPATTPGMVVAKQGEPWRELPELRWQVWPHLPVPDAT